ncbi:hypothetical protein SAY86_024889 [Trapa natans]|uniref:Uncharacterized protein n=1 Tax=Trapa natans TaxID=22666 RepID=A0AAN7M604_TRANT|nr:hypothetical protein SAY86_024889 [Trapa natans]
MSVKRLHDPDLIGRKIQYDCLGFLPNRRQHRMAGLAAIEIAQKIQISEPCDPVVWVNNLRTLNVAKMVIKEKHHVHNKKDEIIDLSKEGKLEGVRYLHRECSFHFASKLCISPDIPLYKLVINLIMDANSCSDLYKAVGEDFWLATWCNSTAFEGKQLEGTRITAVKMEHGFNFAIRTPCTPARWEDFDAEM